MCSALVHADWISYSCTQIHMVVCVPNRVVYESFHRGESNGVNDL